LKLKVKLLLLLATIFFSGCTLIPIAGQPWYGKYKFKLSGDTVVSQRFYVSDRNLTMINLYLQPSYELKQLKKPKELFLLPANKFKQVKKAKPVSLTKKQLLLTLQDDQGKVLRTVFLPLKKINSSGFYSFKFKPLSQSKQKWFRFSLKLTGQPKVPVVLAVAARARQYPGYHLWLNKQIYPEMMLKFQPYIKPTFLMVMHSIGWRLLADKPFLFTYLIFMFLLFILVIVSWRQAKKAALSQEKETFSLTQKTSKISL